MIAHNCVASQPNPPAVVRHVFDSSQVARDRSFARGLNRPAVYEPSPREVAEYVALMLAEQDREIEDRFLAYEFEDQAAGRLTDADIAVVAGCC